jgi:hypothetical protein
LKLGKVGIYFVSSIREWSLKVRKFQRELKELMELMEFQRALEIVGFHRVLLKLASFDFLKFVTNKPSLNLQMNPSSTLPTSKHEKKNFFTSLFACKSVLTSSFLIANLNVILQ